MGTGVNFTRSSIVNILIAAALMACALSPVAAQPQRAAAVELEEAYRWFDGLDYPNLANLPFVEVQYIDDMGYPREAKPRKRVGFLVADSGSEFTVFYPDLTNNVFHASPPSVSAANRVSYAKVDILRWVVNRAAVFDTSEPWNLRGESLSNLLEDPAQFFVLGRACAAHGHTAVADDLVNASLKGGGRSNMVPDSSLKKYLEAVMATSALSQAIKLLEKPDTARVSTLSDFRYVARRFPDTKEGAKAANILPVLARMAEEDRAHDPNLARRLDELPLLKRIEELIFELRDENGSESSMMETDLFAGKLADKSAGNRLIKIGMPAVPALIGSLESQNYTRCIPRNRHTTVAWDIYSVGDFARAIIERIANKSFYQYDSPGSLFGSYTLVADAKERAAVTAKIEEWWSEINSKGEKAFLIAEVERGDNNSGLQASKLCERYPTDALPAIRVGLSHASEPYTINNLLGALATIKDSAVVPVLKTYVNSNAELSIRTGAACHLLVRGDLSPLPEMIRAWKQDKTPDSRYALGPDNGVQQLIVYLRNVGQPEAINVLADGLDLRSGRVRAEVVDLLSQGEHQYSLTGSANGLVTIEPGRLAKLSVAIEGLLARELLDTEQRHNTFYPGRTRLDNPRLCELAAAGLGNIFPMKYAFKQSSSMLDINAQRLAFYNIWLKSVGKPLLAAFPPDKPRL